MRRAAALLLALGLPGCTGGQEPGAPPAPPRSAREAAAAVWAVAAIPDPTPGTLRDVFVEGPLVKQTPRLLDLLATLPELRPEVVREEELPDLGITVVELTAPLPAGGSTTMSVHARARDDGTWRVAWVAAPAGSWPVVERPAL